MHKAFIAAFVVGVVAFAASQLLRDALLINSNQAPAEKVRLPSLEELFEQPETEKPRDMRMDLYISAKSKTYDRCVNESMSSRESLALMQRSGISISNLCSCYSTKYAESWIDNVSTFVVSESIDDWKDDFQSSNNFQNAKLEAKAHAKALDFDLKAKAWNGCVANLTK